MNECHSGGIILIGTIDNIFSSFQKKNQKSQRMPCALISTDHEAKYGCMSDERIGDAPASNLIHHECERFRHLATDEILGQMNC